MNRARIWAVFCLLLAPGAYAADDGRIPELPPGRAIELTPGQKLFSRLDLNNDGALSRQEASQRRALREDFERWDSNGDGKLGYSEFSVFEVYADAEENGIPDLPPGKALQLTPTQKAFSRLDLNNDGALSRAEASQRKAIEQDFERWDTNGDGKLGYSEFSAFEVYDDEGDR